MSSDKHKTEGYTEPDPRLDLSGTDVARKILDPCSRGRLSDSKWSDIENVPFLPRILSERNGRRFLRGDGTARRSFSQACLTMPAEGLKLKYIASFDNGKASVGLASIGPDHNFANLSGKDNAVLFYTNRYSEQPLVIKGAGAGADVTAAGVFADIIRASRT